MNTVVDQPVYNAYATPIQFISQRGTKKRDNNKKCKTDVHAQCHTLILQKYITNLIDMEVELHIFTPRALRS